MADTPKRKRGRRAHTPEERTTPVLMRVKPETARGFALLMARQNMSRTEVVDALVAAAVARES